MTRYRNRVRCRVTERGRVEFFNPNKLEECPVLEESVLEGIGVARALVQRDVGLARAAAHLEVRARDSRGQGALVFQSHSDNAGLRLEGRHGDWLVCSRAQQRVPHQRWYVSDDVYVDVPVNGFMQVNSAVNRQLVEHMQEGLLARKTDSFADLYMGSGNFALPLLAAGLSGSGVESHTGAVRAARRAAAAQRLAPVAFHAVETRVQLQVWSRQAVRPRAVIVDPPRAGLRDAARSVAALAGATLVMCSCWPPTLCRDLRVIVESGFGVEQVVLFDMFPQTSHLEVVVWLRRRTGAFSSPGPRSHTSSNIFS